MLLLLLALQSHAFRNIPLNNLCLNPHTHIPFFLFLWEPLNLILTLVSEEAKKLFFFLVWPPCTDIDANTHTHTFALKCRHTNTMKYILQFYCHTYENIMYTLSFYEICITSKRMLLVVGDSSQQGALQSGPGAVALQRQHLWCRGDLRQSDHKSELKWRA